MEIKIAMFKGVSRATLNAVPIAVLMGPNKSGKTSACQAITAALTGQAMPDIGLAKSLSGALVHGGAEKGMVQIKTEDGRSVVKWPSADYETEGKHPMSSVFAAGCCDKNNVWSLFAMKEKDRSAALADVLKAHPDLEKDLRPMLEKLDVDEERLAKAIKSIDDNGFDPIWDKMKKHGAKLKAQWELTTNDNWGATKADGWIPKDWEEDLQDISEQALDAALADAREALESQIATTAVDEAALASLKETAAGLEAARKAYAAAEKAFKKTQKDLAKASDELVETPAPGSVDDKIFLTCPHCNKNSQLKAGTGGYRLEEPAANELSEDERAALQEAYDVAKAAHDAVTNIHNEANKSLSLAEEAVETAEAAGVEVAELEESAKTAVSEDVIDAARQEVANCEVRIAKRAAYFNAAATHKSVVSNQAIVDILAPAGLRKTILKKALDNFHKRLRALCELAEWDEISLDEDDLELRYGPRRFALMSESEKFRTRCILQVAFAEMDGSYAVVIDGADVLDVPARMQLFKMLLKKGTRAVVTITLGGKEEIPAWIGKAMNGTKGNAYWVEKGVASEALFAG